MLNQQFVNQMIELIKASDVRIHEPEWRKIILVEGEKPTHHLGAFADSNKKTQIKDNEVLLVILLFSLLDGYVDANYSSFEGENLKHKYDKLPCSNDKEIMIRELYRVLRILRNAAIHSRSNVNKINNGIHAYYSQTSSKCVTNFEVKISVLGLELIGTFIIMALSQSTRSESYDLGLLRSFYDDIQKEINTFSDEAGNCLMAISNGLRLNRSSRYEVANPKFSIETELIIDQSILGQSESIYSEYIIPIEKKKYLVPNEALDEDGKISLPELEKWKIDEIK